MNRNQLLLFYNLKPSVVDIFRGVKPSEFHHCQTEQELLDFLKGTRAQGEIRMGLMVVKIYSHLFTDLIILFQNTTLSRQIRIRRR